MKYKVSEMFYIDSKGLCMTLVV